MTHDSHGSLSLTIHMVLEKKTKLNKIDENLDLIEKKNNIKTKITKLNENKDQIY